MTIFYLIVLSLAASFIGVVKYPKHQIFRYAFSGCLVFLVVERKSFHPEVTHRASPEIMELVKEELKKRRENE